MSGDPHPEARFNDCTGWTLPYQSIPPQSLESLASNVTVVHGGCPHCGTNHTTTCPRIKAIEYFENGTVKRMEFHEQKPLAGINPSSFRHQTTTVWPQSGYTYVSNVTWGDRPRPSNRDLYFTMEA